ncbi:uncharacterized protein [Euwallacea fornicatus]|uniref:uncharacterized protein n=1 Tax=Euwallacea fornicatus TaxID=995702 RepID=UPI00338E4EF3
METVWNKTGKVQEIPLNRPKLREGAIPHLLIGLPSKSTTQLPSLRSPKVKKGVIVKREDKVLELCLQNDIVHNFDAFLEQFNTRVKLQQWQFKITSRAVYFYILNVSCDCSEENIIDEGLKIISSISINSDLIVRIYIDNKEVSTDDLICVFGETKKLSHWWQFENIITRYGNY